jgi:hypothetical protein
MKSSSQVAMLIQRYYMEFRDFFKRRADMSHADQKRWTKPRSEFMKINIDASFREGEKRGRLGLCCSEQSRGNRM